MIIKLPLLGLSAPVYYYTLFPLPRDRSILSKSFTTHGYIAHFPIVVSKINGEYKIIDGVGRHRELLELGMKTAEVVIKDFSSETEARAFTAFSNLKTPMDESGLNLVHLCLLARDFARTSGEKYKRELVLECSGKDLQSYRVANRSLNFALDELRKNHPEWRKLPDTELVAEALDPPVWQKFKCLLSGEMTIWKFDKEIYAKSPMKKEQQRKQAKAVMLSKQTREKTSITQKEETDSRLGKFLSFLPELTLPEILEVIFAITNQEVLTFPEDASQPVSLPSLALHRKEIKKLRALGKLLEETLKQQIKDAQTTLQFINK